jgi:Tfp pilus assembly protein PilN
MRTLELDLVRRRARWPGWLLALVGLALALDAGSTWLRLRDEAREAAQQGAARAVRTAPPEPMSEQTQREFDAARRVLAELAQPWEQLFRAIEGALDKDTALLAIEPDAGKQALQISGEARHYAAILRFMTRLESSGTLSRVHLLSHEVQDDAPERPTRFTLAASWRAAP